VFVEVALLVVGLTWIGPLSAREDGSATAAPAGTDAYRIEGEGTGNVVEVNLVAEETTQTIAEGVEYRVWTFNGTAPGPVIRVSLGDTIRFTLTNDSSENLSHSIDFHAAQTPWDRDYQPVAPGETYTFDWVARFPGVFMYHCGVPPVLHHIANGMYGAIVVEPEGLEPAREFVLTSASSPATGRTPTGLGATSRRWSRPSRRVVFDGMANRYATTPLGPGRAGAHLGQTPATLTRSTSSALFDHVPRQPDVRLNGMQFSSPRVARCSGCGSPTGPVPIRVSLVRVHGLGVSASAVTPDACGAGNARPSAIVHRRALSAARRPRSSRRRRGGQAEGGPIAMEASITGFAPRSGGGEVRSRSQPRRVRHDFTI
jgi:plastocyanin